MGQFFKPASQGAGAGQVVAQTFYVMGCGKAAGEFVGDAGIKAVMAPNDDMGMGKARGLAGV